MPKSFSQILTETINLEPAHFEMCCRNRTDTPQSEGSFYPGLETSDKVREAVMGAEWEAYTHSEIMAPAIGYIAPRLGGTMNLARVTDLHADTQVVLKDAHHGNNLKDDHFVEAEVVSDVGGVPVDFSVALVGPRSREDATPVLWTFFPGDPIRPSRLPASGNHGRVIDVADARMLGVKWAKVVRPTRNVFTALVLVP